jgi:hypothetical protein
MLYELLRFGHLIGLLLIGAGLIGVFLSDIRTRQAKTLPVFAEAVAQHRPVLRWPRRPRRAATPWIRDVVDHRVL